MKAQQDLRLISCCDKCHILGHILQEDGILAGGHDKGRTKPQRSEGVTMMGVRRHRKVATCGCSMLVCSEGSCV
jgi:hypothetical protein